MTKNVGDPIDSSVIGYFEGPTLAEFEQLGLV